MLTNGLRTFLMIPGGDSARVLLEPSPSQDLPDEKQLEGESDEKLVYEPDEELEVLVDVILLYAKKQS
jgi:hypothetical protein